MDQIRELRKLGIRELRHVLRPYLIGVKHGISLADLDHQCNAQIKEVDDMLAALEERDGQESAAQADSRA
jgi:hypothetical protein